MDILFIYLSRFLLSELYGVNPQIILLIIFSLLFYNFVINPINFLKIANNHIQYFFAISLLLVISLFNIDIDSILNILILFTLPFIKWKSYKYSKFFTYFILMSTIIYCIIILKDFSVYANRSHNYLLLGRGILVSQAIILFTNFQESKYYKLAISLLFLIALSIMHGRLNAIVSILLVILYLIKNFKYSWILLVSMVFSLSLLLNLISTLNIGTIKRLLNDQQSISDRIGLVQTGLEELQDITTLLFGGGKDYSNTIAFEKINYPYFHNLPIELLLDFGIFAIPILIIWSLMLIKSGKIIFLEKEILLPVLLIVESFQFFKSFEFNQSASLFLIITLFNNKEYEV